MPDALSVPDFHPDLAEEFPELQAKTYPTQTKTGCK